VALTDCENDRLLLRLYKRTVVEMPRKRPGHRLVWSRWHRNAEPLQCWL